MFVYTNTYVEMGTKTIGITEKVYERLRARKRENESFTELIDRLLDDAAPDWRESFGSLDAESTEQLEQAALRGRNALSRGLSRRQADAIERLTAIDGERDETP